MGEKLIPLFREAYLEISFPTHQEVEPGHYCATYNIGLFFDDNDHLHQPCGVRLDGLHRTAAYILGVEPSEALPRIALADDDRPIAEPYVCIAVQSSTHCKYWNNPNGWREIVRFLKDCGYASFVSTRSRRTAMASCGSGSRSTRKEGSRDRNTSLATSAAWRRAVPAFAGAGFSVACVSQRLDT